MANNLTGKYSVEVDTTVRYIVPATIDNVSVVYTPTRPLPASSSNYIDQNYMEGSSYVAPNHVSTVFGRTDDVVAQVGDYNATQVVTSAPIAGVSAGSSVESALVMLYQDTFQAECAEPIPVNSFVKIINSKIHLVKSNDTTTPRIDGFTLEAGALNDVIKVGRNTNFPYATTSSTFLADSPLFLNQAGSFTTVRPTKAMGDNYLFSVGRTVANTSTIIFDPKIPIKLYV